MIHDLEVREARRGVGLLKAKIALAGMVLWAAGAGAQSCPATLAVVVKDTTDAVVANARVTLDGRAVLTTDKAGLAVYKCIAAGKHALHVEAESFAAQDTTVRAGAASVQMKLKPQSVNETVNAVDSGVGATENVAGEKTLTSKDLAAMADDPDDFKTQLEALAAASGGAPGAAIVTVDGFQGASKMPPKSAIAFIKVNPDLFSAEYGQPPYEGGRIEVYTKPGQDRYHGALFFTYGGSDLNARDPYAQSTQATGKRRYGFELTGPAWSKKSDFTLDLEKRDIDEYAVVNATTLDGSGNPMNLIQSVATPQRLWQGNARLGMQWGPKTIATLTYEADVNSEGNQGVGGSTLAEVGYDTVQSEYTVHGTAMSTVSPNLIHEGRVSFQWQDRDDTPHSKSVSLQVAGAFTGGGVSTQALRSHVKNIELDDDVIWNHKKHMVKAGVQMLDAVERVNAPTNFNGTYTFGGGPGVSGLQQYQAGGPATTYSITTGDPEINFNQLRLVLFVQDQWKWRSRLQFALGLRYALQTDPGTYGNFAPRAGLSWSPDKKQKWVLRARTGLFNSPISTGAMMQTLALNGVRQQQISVYGATYCNPVTPSCNPVPAGAVSIQTLQQFAPGGVSQNTVWQSQFAVEHDLPGRWHGQANLYLAKGWDMMRSRNVNAPLNDVPTGPRPGAANENVFQYQQTGNLHGNVMFLAVDQRTMKHLQLFLGYLRMDLRGDADSANFFPQSALTDAGETARPSWETTHRVLAFGQLMLPWKLTLSEQMNLYSGSPYNVTTGFDNNGDGVFNDRPQYASAPGPGVYATRFGLLTASGGTGVMPRNSGTMPWTVHLDMNLARTFALTKGKNHPQSLALNVRSANVLNHTNVTAVDGVLGSPQFGQAIAADSGRRIEFGARYSF